MSLYQFLSQQDKQLIEDYLLTYTKDLIDCSSINLEQTLREWSLNKETLYKAFDKKFRISTPITTKLDLHSFCELGNQDYWMPSWYYLCGWSVLDYQYFIEQELASNHILHPLSKQLLLYFGQLSSNKTIDINLQKISTDLTNILSYKTFYNGWADFTYNTLSYHNQTLKLNNDIKPLRALRKILELIQFPHMELYHDFCDYISRLSTYKNLQTNLVFSIHPIDFFTMSHNNNNWTTCVSWTDGCYSNGVLEMLNSDNAIVAYFESSKAFRLHGRNIPNKAWRCLFYANQTILLAGKPYPYKNDEVIKQGINFLETILYKNLGWTYRYHCHMYNDMKNIIDNNQAKNITNCRKPQIIVYTNPGMNNDMVLDKQETYWCCSNAVDSTVKICLSGSATCLICGNCLDNKGIFKNPQYYKDEDCYSYGSNHLCSLCRQKGVSSDE